MSNIFLISEEIPRDNYEFLIEEKAGKQHLYIKGVFGQADIVNKNKRRYKLPILENAVNNIQQKIQSPQGLLGELNHPQRATVDPKKAAMKINSLSMDRKDMLGEAIAIPGLPNGDALIALYNVGCILPVSTRALGRVIKCEGFNDVEDMELRTVDVVYDQSAPNATPDMFVESTNWLIDIGAIDSHEAQLLEDFKKQNSTEAVNKLYSEAINDIIHGITGIFKQKIKNF